MKTLLTLSSMAFLLSSSGALSLELKDPQLRQDTEVTVPAYLNQKPVLNKAAKDRYYKRMEQFLDLKPEELKPDYRMKGDDWLDYDHEFIKKKLESNSSAENLDEFGLIRVFPNKLSKKRLMRKNIKNLSNSFAFKRKRLSRKEAFGLAKKGKVFLTGVDQISGKNVAFIPTKRGLACFSENGLRMAKNADIQRAIKLRAIPIYTTDKLSHIPVVHWY